MITNRYQARFTEPWFLGLRMPLIVTGEWEPRIKSSLQDYAIRSWSVSAATTRRYGEEINVSLGVEYQSVKISGVPENQIQIKKEEEDISERRKIYLVFRTDDREDIFVPRDGTVSHLSFEYYGGRLGGDESFYRWEASLASFEAVWPGWISATRFKVGVAEPFGETGRVPREDRLYLGGASTVRGFRENSLGPLREDGEADGANYLVIFNQEFRWQTVQVTRVIPLLSSLFKKLPLWQSLFFDAGNGFAELRDVKFGRMAYAFGTGVQIISPVGPIRLDYARRIKTDRYDLGDRWHFTILYPF